MLHNCKLSSELSARNTEIDLKAIDQFASLIETNTQTGFPRSEFKSKFQQLGSLEKGINAKTLGDGFNGKPLVINKPQTVQIDEKLESAKTTLSRNGHPLATKEEVLKFTEKEEGYSVEVGAYSNADDAIKMIKRFKKHLPKLIYLSKQYQEDKSIILRVLIGNEKHLDAITNLQERIDFGVIRSFNDIKNDI